MSEEGASVAMSIGITGNEQGDGAEYVHFREAATEQHAADAATSVRGLYAPT